MSWPADTREACSSLHIPIAMLLYKTLCKQKGQKSGVMALGMRRKSERVGPRFIRHELPEQPLSELRAGRSRALACFS